MEVHTTKFETYDFISEIIKQIIHKTPVTCDTLKKNYAVAINDIR